MVTCAVPDCNSCREENPQNYSFHVFPQNKDVRQKWLKMINREDWVPYKYSSICSKHFEQKCFTHRGSQRMKLRYGSIPTLFMPVVLKPKRQVSSYIYRDISPVPSTSTANVIALENSPREKKMKKTIDILRRRLQIVKRKLKNVRAQKKRACERVIKLSQVIKNLENLPSLQKDVGAVMGSCSNDSLQNLIDTIE